MLYCYCCDEALGGRIEVSDSRCVTNILLKAPFKIVLFLSQIMYSTIIAIFYFLSESKINV